MVSSVLVKICYNSCFDLFDSLKDLDYFVKNHITTYQKPSNIPLTKGRGNIFLFQVVSNIQMKNPAMIAHMTHTTNKGHMDKQPLIIMDAISCERMSKNLH